MPLFYQHTTNGSTCLAVWHIQENEKFFLKSVQIKKEITHPHKRLQHLAGRYLLKHLQPGFPLHLIEAMPYTKPWLSNKEFHFSISHCGDYVAVILSKKFPVGIDVELITPKVALIKNKFLSAGEIDILLPGRNLFLVKDNQLLTLFWSCKEVMFKWYGKGKVDFKKNMIIEKLFFEEGHGFVSAHFIKENKVSVKVEFRFFNNLCLAWLVK